MHIDTDIAVYPKYVGTAIDCDRNVFGCRYRNVNYGTGSYRECVGHPITSYETVGEIEANYIWPSADWFDYSVIPEQVRDKEEIKKFIRIEKLVKI